ncbi:MAG: hypothetical protein DRP46_02050 [Candidatus Zixiibacteriota bacterium]|nr:MAG: hypothetical protein DRP46_02050 [candidate division Zixibacteria bacterium]
MRRLTLPIIMFALAILAAPVFAGYLNDVNEVIAGNQIGIGAKQMAMGGTGMMTIDGTAIFYNPANLTRIPRIEFMLGMSYNKQKSDITTRAVGEESGFDVSDSKSNTRISSAILTVPYPTYRGALVFGFGVARLSDFDRISNFYFEEIDEGEVRTSNEKVKESGGLNQWAFGFGIDLSPRISFGGALMVYHGKHELNLKSPLYYAGAMESDFEQLLEYRYIGYGAKIGLGMQLSRRIGLGMAIESPVMLDIDQDGSEIEFGIITPYSTVEYELKKPFVFSAGAVSRFDYFTLMADIEYTDWSQMSYSDNMAMELFNDEIEEVYKEVLRFRIGGEYVVPSIDLALRAGFFNDPLPYQEMLSYKNDSRYGYSFGFGFLVDQVMMIDFAYVHGSFSDSFILESPDFVETINLDEDIKNDRLFLTVSYRF